MAGTTAGQRSMGITARLAVLALAAMTGACSSLSEETGLDLMASASAPPAQDLRPANEGGLPQTELGKATEYWGKEYAKNPSNAAAAIAYAKNLKALGNKQEAFNILAQAAQTTPENRELAAEYGRLALDLEKVSLAAQLLEVADDPMRPDWRVVSARGAAMAKLGRYKDAVQHLERANMLAPEQVAVQNNLALAYAMNGEAAKAEGLLRQAVARGGGSPKTKQNLALVLGLQGKYDEATQVGSTVVSADVARENTSVLRQMVKLDPKASQPFTAPPALAAAPAPIWPAQAQAPTQVQAPAAPVAFKPATIDNASASSWDATVVSSAPAR
ncbi:MAG: hypothetical protein B7Y80_14740 [Hyphomicrobium sp. 32-62-53]|nr:MAG: hypothetical protein B7Z29_15725 [Hyphomicrobium sp. 12-62-95]OYX98587.1 MAG: hypothetical protein B7Y80_14740 [Hyphomicrobium sp. 32-62-53]